MSSPEDRIKSSHLIILGFVMIALGVVGDIAMQHTTSDHSLSVDKVDIQHDSVTLHSNQSFGDRVVERIREDHLALIAGVLAGLPAFQAVWRRRKKAADKV